MEDYKNWLSQHPQNGAHMSYNGNSDGNNYMLIVYSRHLGQTTDIPHYTCFPRITFVVEISKLFLYQWQRGYTVINLKTILAYKHRSLLSGWSPLSIQCAKTSLKWWEINNWLQNWRQTRWHYTAPLGRNNIFFLFLY